jgi:hypothetical protein
MPVRVEFGNALNYRAFNGRRRYIFSESFAR